jgi:phage terminase Nu1 subunit (DNA packaging protein)
MKQTITEMEVSLTELAELMQTTEPRILRLVETQGLPTFRKFSEWRFRLNEVSAWMNRQSFATAARERRPRSFEATQSQRA